MKWLVLYKGCIVRKFFFKNIDFLKIFFLEYWLVSKFEIDNEVFLGSVYLIFEKKILFLREGWGYNGVEYLFRNV